MTSDKWLTRLFGITVCLLTVLCTTTACWMFLHKLDVPDPLDRLVTFLVGAITGRLTTSRQSEVTDSPLPTTVVNAPSDPVPTADTGPSIAPAVAEAELHPDAPETSDL